MRNVCRSGLLAAILFCIATQPGFSQRTPLKPGGFNLFSTQEEVELGRQVAQDAEKKNSMLNNARVDEYLNRLGRRLAANAPGEKYPYQFKCVNDGAINAFALPGGFVYINRGVIEAADNEAELAGVIGHEIGHVALRHGTKQASKSSLLSQGAAGVLGAILGGKSAGALAAQIGTGFALNSILLKYSRDDERQADLMGAQILYDSNYDPRYLATFFEKLGKGNRGIDFFSSHPNPENRIQNIEREIARLGARSSAHISDGNEFRSIRRMMQSLPPAPRSQSSQAQSSASQQQGRPAKPSNQFRFYDAGNLSVRHPDNWEAYGETQAFTIAPQGGIVQVGSQESLSYGAMMAVYSADSGSRSGTGLKSATDQLIRELRSSNSELRLSREEQIRVGGQTALSKHFTNNAATGGREVNWLVTVLRPEGLVYFIFVAPEPAFGDYQRAFEQVLGSVRFK